MQTFPSALRRLTFELSGAVRRPLEGRVGRRSLRAREVLNNWDILNEHVIRDMEYLSDARMRQCRFPIKRTTNHLRFPPGRVRRIYEAYLILICLGT